MAFVDDLLSHISRYETAKGEGAGSPLRLMPWQVELYETLFPREDKWREGLLAYSMARGGGKTATGAMLGASWVDNAGPFYKHEATFNTPLSIVTPSHDLGRRTLFSVAVHFLGGREEVAKNYRFADTLNLSRIINKTTGAIFQVLGSNSKRLQGGEGPSQMDEAAQFEAGQVQQVYNALTGSEGKALYSLVLGISTLPESPVHPFRKMLQEPGSRLWTVPKDADPFDPQVWELANPSLPFFPKLRAAYEAHAERAKNDPSEMASFRTYKCNQGTNEQILDLVLPPEVWERIEGNALPDGPVVFGLDRGLSNAMSAIAAYWPQSGRLDAVAGLPRQPDLAIREQNDGVAGDRLYQEMVKRSELHLLGEHNTDLAALLQVAIKRFGYPRSIASDRFFLSDLAETLHNAGLSDIPIVPRGMGFVDMGQDLTAFRDAAYEGRLTPVKSLMIRAGMASARVVYDEAANPKLAKGSQGNRRFRSKDDVVCAAILATAEGKRFMRAAAGGSFRVS